jgi:hypothetical protein
LVKKYFHHHGCWHALRDPSYPQKKRDECFPPGGSFPKGLRAWNEPGSGEDFLRFHREMIRNFKWIISVAPGPKYSYKPWVDLPIWLAPVLDAMDPFYRQKLGKKLEEMVDSAILDDLGRFIEGPEANDEFPQVHWVVHDLVATYEELVFGPQRSADMSAMATAPLNEHFWGLHGWIDEIYARWQTNNGEVVDQTPLEPHEHAMCDACRQLKSNPTFLGRWEAYLKVRSQ